MVQQRTARAVRVTGDDLGHHEAVVTGRDAGHDPAHQPGEYALEHRYALRARTPAGRRAEAVRAAAGEGGRRVPLMLAEDVDADVLGLGEDRPAEEEVPTPNEIIGGSAETEVSEVAVKPTGRSPVR